jgi:hypothetical protein
MKSFFATNVTEAMDKMQVLEQGLLARREAKVKTSERYSMVSTSNVLERVLSAAENRGYTVDHISARVKGQAGTRHFVKVRFANRLGSSTEGQREFVLFNSFNGEQALQMHLGFYRFICSNGLVVPAEGMDDVNIRTKQRHISGPMMTEFTKQLDYRIAAVFDAMERLDSRFAELTNKPVEKTVELRILDGLGLGKKQRKAIDDIRSGSLGRDHEGNLFALYNAVNEGLRRTGRSEFRDVERNTNLLSNIEELYHELAA